MKVYLAILLSLMLFLGGCMGGAEKPLPRALETPPSQFSADYSEDPKPTDEPIGLEPGDESECDNPFYPASDGATWTYLMSTGDEVIHTMEADDFGNFVIDVSTTGGSSAKIEGQCTEEGLVIMNTAGATTTVSDEDGGSSVSTVQSSGVSLPNDISIGEQWSQTIIASTQLGTSEIQSDYEAIGFENITVPAGNFYTLKVEQSGYVTLLGQKIAMHGFAWYAEGVGVVRSAMDDAPVIELVSYDIPD